MLDLTWVQFTIIITVCSSFRLLSNVFNLHVQAFQTLITHWYDHSLGVEDLT